MPLMKQEYQINLGKLESRPLEKGSQVDVKVDKVTRGENLG